MRNHIAPTKKISTKISVIFYGSSAQNRMTSFGPKPLFSIKNNSLIEHQIQVLQNDLINPEIFIVGAFELEKIINKGYKVIENQIQSNECDDIRLALNLCSNKNILLIDQAAYFNTVKFNYNKSFIVVGNEEDEISVNYSQYLEHLSFNDNIMKWKHITFIHENIFQTFKSFLDTKNYTRNFLFELINNLIDSKIKFEVQQSQGFIINSPKRLRELQ